MKQLDPSIEIPNTILADYLSDMGGLNEQEKLMIQTVVGNKAGFDAVALALKQRHPDIHVPEGRVDKKSPRQTAFQGQQWRRRYFQRCA